MLDIIKHQQWIVIALAFFGILAYIAIIRWLDRKWINEPDSLFYRSRVKKIELLIPGRRIARVYHDKTHKGVNLHQSMVKIDFINDNDERDTAAFKVPYPPQWINAIEKTLLKDRRA